MLLLRVGRERENVYSHIIWGRETWWDLKTKWRVYKPNLHIFLLYFLHRGNCFMSNWSRKWQPSPWKIPQTEEPGRLQSIGSQRVGRD